MPSDTLTLRDILHRGARWFPDNVAVSDETRQCTYGELLDRSLRCAALLHSLGVRKRDRVVFLLHPSVDHTIALFGSIELGALPVGLHTRESAAGLRRVVERLSPRLLVYDVAFQVLADELLARSPEITGVVRVEADGWSTSAHPVIPADLSTFDPFDRAMPIHEDEPVAIVLTSGTTGVPKGIVHTHRTLMEMARAGVYVWNGIKPNDCMLTVLSVSFAGWFYLTLPFLNVGGRVVFRRAFDPADYVRTIAEEGVTCAMLVPTMWRMVLAQDAPRAHFSTVRRAAFAGEPMDMSTLRHMQDEITPHVVNVYGTTESGSLSGGTLMWEDDMVEQRVTSVGKPMLNADVRVIEVGGSVRDQLPRGEIGELVIRGPSVASEVWDDPEATARIFEHPGPWWHSGDLGRIDEDGFLFLEGRADDMIISGGMNIMPVRVEEALLAHPRVLDCAVVPAPDQMWGQVVKAVVVAKDSDLTDEELDDFLLAGELANFERPRRYAFVEALPRTGTGKVNRRALRAQGEG